jgi:hypothetical protein
MLRIPVPILGDEEGKVENRRRVVQVHDTDGYSVTYLTENQLGVKFNTLLLASVTHLSRAVCILVVRFSVLLLELGEPS